MLQKMLPSIVTNVYISGRYKLQKQSAKYKIPIRNTCKLFIIYTVSSFGWLYLSHYSQKKLINQKHFNPPFSLFQEIVISNFPLFQQNYTSYTKETAENIILKKQTNSFSESLYDAGQQTIPLPSDYLKGCQKKLSTEEPQQMSLLFREMCIQNYIGRLKSNNSMYSGTYHQYGTKETEVQPKGGSFQPTTAPILGPYLRKNINNSGNKQNPELLFFARKPLFPLQHKINANVASSWRLGGNQNKRPFYVEQSKGQSNSYDVKNLFIGPEFDLLPRRMDKVNKKIKVKGVWPNGDSNKPRSTICSVNFKPKLGKTEQLQLCNYSNINKLVGLGFPPKYTPNKNVSLQFASTVGSPRRTGIRSKGVPTSNIKVKIVHQEKTNSNQICRTFSLYNPLSLNRTNCFTDLIVDSRLQSGFNFPDVPIINKNSMFLKKENIYSKKKEIFFKNINYNSPTASISVFNNGNRNKGLGSLPVFQKDKLSHIALPPVRLSSSRPGANYNALDFANRGYFDLQPFLPVIRKDGTGNNQMHVLEKRASSESKPHLQSTISARHRYTPFIELVYTQKPVQGYMFYDQTHGYVHLNTKSPAIYNVSKENNGSSFSRFCTFGALTPTGDLRNHCVSELWDLTAQNLFANLLRTGDMISSKQEQPTMLIESQSRPVNLNVTDKRSNLSETNYVDSSVSAQTHAYDGSSSTGLSKYFVPVKRLIQKTQSLVGFNKILSFPNSGKVDKTERLRPKLSRTYPFVILNKNGDIQTVKYNVEKHTHISPNTTNQQVHVPESFFGTPYLQLGERFTIEHLKGKNQMGVILNVHTGDIFTPDALSYSTSLGSGIFCSSTDAGQAWLPGSVGLPKEDPMVRTSLQTGVQSDVAARSNFRSNEIPKQFPIEQLYPVGSTSAEPARPPVFPFASTGTSFTTVFGKKRLTKLRSKKMQSPVTNGRMVSQWSSTNLPYRQIETTHKEIRTKVAANKEISGSLLNLLPGHSTTESVGQPQVKLNTQDSLRSLLYFKRISGKANRHIINPFKYYNPGTKRDRNIEDTLLTLEGYKKSRLFAQTHTYYGGVTVPFLPIEFLQGDLSTIHDLALWDPHLQSILGGMRQRTESQRIAQNVTGAPPLNNEDLKRNKSQNFSCSSHPNIAGTTEEILQDHYSFGSSEQFSFPAYGQHEGNGFQESPEQSNNADYSRTLIAEQEQASLFQGYNKKNKKKRFRSTNCYPLRTLLAARSQKSFSQIPLQPTDRSGYIYSNPTSMSINSLWSLEQRAPWMINEQSTLPEQRALPPLAVSMTADGKGITLPCKRNPALPTCYRNSLWSFPASNTLIRKGKLQPLYSKPDTNGLKGSGKTKGFYFENFFSPAIRVQNERMYFSNQPKQKHTNLVDLNNYNENLKWGFRQSLVGACRYLPISFRFSKILFFVVVWSSYKILAKGLLNPSGAARVSQSTQFLPAAFTEAVGLQTFQQKYRIITAKKTTQSFKNLAGAEKTLSELRDLIWTFHLVGTGGPRGEHSPFAPLPYIGGQAGQERTSVISKARNRFLLVGPPGTGKTLLVKTLAAEANVPVIVQPASQLRMIAGVENPVSALFRVARQIKPCIIFLDELDTLGNNLHTSATGTTAEQKLGIRLARKYTYTLLLELDGLTSSTRDLLIIGATNRPETLNPALTRAGRFDTFINCNLPSQEQRFAVLSLYLSNQNKKGEKYQNSIVRSAQNSLVSIESQVFTSIGLTFGKSDNNSVNPGKANTVLPVLHQNNNEIKHFYTNYIAQKCFGLSQASIGAVVNQSALESMLNFSSPALHTLKTLERAIESVKLLTPESTNLTVYQQTPVRSISSSIKKKLTLNTSTEGGRLVPLTKSFKRPTVNSSNVKKKGLQNNTQSILNQLRAYARVIKSKGMSRTYPNLKIGKELPESDLASSKTFRLRPSFSHTQGLQFFVYKAYQTSSSSIASHLMHSGQPFSVDNFSLERSKAKTLTNLTFDSRSTHPTNKHDLEQKILKGYAQHASVNLYSATRPQNLKFSEIFGIHHNNLESNLLILKQLVLTTVNKTALTEKQTIFDDETATGGLLLERPTKSMTVGRANQSILFPGNVRKLSTAVSVHRTGQGQNQNQQNISSRFAASSTLTSSQTRKQSDIGTRSTYLSEGGSAKTMQKPVREVIRNSDPLTTGWFRLYLSRPIVRYDNLSYIENKEYYPQNNYILRPSSKKPLYSRNISTLAHSFLNFEKNKPSIRDQRYHGIAGKRKQQKFVSNKIWRETIANKSVMEYSTPFDHYFNHQIQPIFLTIVAYFFHKMCVIFKENRELVDYCVYSKLRYNVIYEFSITQICKKF